MEFAQLLRKDLFSLKNLHGGSFARPMDVRGKLAGYIRKLAKLLTTGTSISFLIFGTLILVKVKSINLVVILNKKFLLLLKDDK